MRNTYNGKPFFFIELFYHRADFGSAFGVEHGSSLVQNENFGFERKRARYRHALFLSARKPCRLHLTEFFHIGNFKGVVYHGANFLARHTYVFRAERHVVLHDRSDLLIIGILKDHSRFFSNIERMSFVRGIHTENAYFAARGGK